MILRRRWRRNYSVFEEGVNIKVVALGGGFATVQRTRADMDGGAGEERWKWPP
jgi:hypothetical protein